MSLCTHAIRPIWHIHRGEDKKKVRLELNMYFDKLLHMVTSTHLKINTETMHQYVVGPTALKMMTHMLSDEFDRGAISVYPNVKEARVHFQQDVTIEVHRHRHSQPSLASIRHRRSSKICRRVGLTIIV